MTDVHPSGLGAPILDSLAKRTSDALRALSHEHRLLILAYLCSRERSVGELEKLLSLPQPAVSQQLARLRHDDLVLSRRDGRTIFYRLNTELMEVVQRNLSLLTAITVDPASLEYAARDAEAAALEEASANAVPEADEPRLTA